MSYILDNLVEGELIKYEGKANFFYKLLLVFGIILCFLIKIGGYGIYHFIVITFFTYQLFYLFTVEIVVTDRRIIYKRGIIARDIFELQLAKIESVGVDQSIFNRIIGAGNIMINGTGGNHTFIKNMDDPFLMKAVIYQQIDVK